MSVAGNAAPLSFSNASLENLAASRQEEYSQGDPFPHIVLDDFLPIEVAKRLCEEFPGPTAPNWLDWKGRAEGQQPRKLGIGHARRLEGARPYLILALNTFNSYPFLNFLEKLTGIEKILPDPYFHGGGIHQILPGGKLDVHTDFNFLESLQLYRRLNALLYLNKDWKPEYGGDLELWDDHASRCMKRISPIFNRLVVFATTKRTFHGHPRAVACPEFMTRKSISLYFYTSQPGDGEDYDEITDWQGKLNDSDAL